MCVCVCVHVRARACVRVRVRVRVSPLSVPFNTNKCTMNISVIVSVRFLSFEDENNQQTGKKQVARSMDMTAKCQEHGTSIQLHLSSLRRGEREGGERKGGGGGGERGEGRELN